MTALRIGCSGWSYEHWKGDFYPAGLARSRWFDWYAERFPTVEINGSFYRLPTEKAVAGWAERAPPGFVFAWKVSRYLTHNKKLSEPQASLDLIFSRMAPLGANSGPALFQLPPNLQRNDERLEGLLERLPRPHRHAIEFRHPSWYAFEVFERLRAHDVALCISDHAAAPSPWQATASFVYVRGHGPGGRYFGRYEEATLRAWAEAIAGWRAERRDVYAYFDNDIGGAAPRDAARLIELCG